MRTVAKRVARLAPTKTDIVRVACYCRLSVTDRVETQFGSIEAQREALHAYVASQRTLGWRAIDTAYEDDGYTGSNTDRPALQQLLHDARSGLVDIVAVVRFDRLSRRQIDLLQTIDELHAHGAGFVSITQSLDTSTAMGRCILGVMGSFAELERDTISERTKAKMIATRRKGMWTGGRPVLGFDVVKKKLVVNEREAQDVRRIFELYLELGGVGAVVQELRFLGIFMKRWTVKSGREQGGNAFDKNTLNSLLRNPLFVGYVRAGDEVVEGEHEAIVERDVWDAVQARMMSQAPVQGARRGKRSAALLSGIARCHCGAAMTPTTCKRHGRTYSYYACARSVKHGKAACPGSRVAAGKLEAFVVEQIRGIGRDPAVLNAAIAADKRARGSERVELAASLGELRAARGKHVGAQQRLLTAMGAGEPPTSLVGRLRELDGFVAEAADRISKAELDLAALDAPSDAQELRDALVEFDQVWSELDGDERAVVLALVLDEVTVNGATGEAELRFRGAR